MAARQKELQPILAELRKKYGDDQQKFARAQMDLWRKHNINPLSGCLPVFLQLPIFIGLYTALNSAVDLRGQRFLWISNLAGPDALFRLPFPLPFGMGHDFSILPLCTVALFLIQQKMFMPPATNEQEAMQQKMMNVMTGVMGIFFWHQPAGLSLYFIASSLWGITERKLLGTGKPQPAIAGGPGVEVIETSSTSEPVRPQKAAQAAPPAESGPKPVTFWQRLMAAAEEAQRQAESQKNRDNKKDRRK
jgi:YidC/Oxa1 family membrane protein insertase